MRGKTDRERQDAGEEDSMRSSSDGRFRHYTKRNNTPGDAAPGPVPLPGSGKPEKPGIRPRPSEEATTYAEDTYGISGRLRRMVPTQLPWNLLLITTAAVFAVEATVMGVIFFFGLKLSIWTSIFDAFVLALVAFPVLFLLFFRPLTRALSEHQRVESELRRSVDTQRSLHRVTSPAVDVLESESLLNGVIDEVLPLVGADAAWVTIPGRDCGDLPRVVARRGVPDEFVAAEVASPLATCPICGPLLDENRAPAGIQLQSGCPRLPKAAFASAGLSTHMGALLRMGNGRKAILNIGWRSPRTLSETDRTLFATVVHQVGISLENAQLYRAERRARKPRRRSGGRASRSPNHWIWKP